jgi:tetraacyldisaccharide 4'-kinase
LNTINSDAGVILVTGIANPAPFKEYLEKYFPNLRHLCFPDHHMFIAKDIEKLIDEFNILNTPEKFIFTTEKDATRLREFTNIAESVKSALLYIPVSIEFLNDDKKEFDNLITDYVRKNKRNNRISES